MRGWARSAVGEMLDELRLHFEHPVRVEEKCPGVSAPFVSKRSPCLIDSSLSAKGFSLCEMYSAQGRRVKLSLINRDSPSLRLFSPARLFCDVAYSIGKDC